jgi:hypothetical protein
MPGSGSSLPSTNRLARSDVFPQLTVAHNERASDHYVPKALGVLRRVFVCGLVDNPRRVEDRDVGVSADFETALLPHWR